MKNNFVSQSVPLGTQDRAAKILTAACTAIQTHELRQISQNELCRMLRISPGTLINWTSRSVHPNQLEAMLQLLERMPEEAWQGLLKRFLRKCPAIDSPQLAHEPNTVTRLRLLLNERRGLTFIRGGSDAARTFVFTAAGRFLAQRAEGGPAVSGIDIHVPDWFVPVDGVTYLPISKNYSALPVEIEEAWPCAIRGQSRMFNGVWSLSPAHQKELLHLASRHPVLVADADNLPASQLRKLAGDKVPIRLLDLRESAADRIHIDFHDA